MSDSTSQAEGVAVIGLAGRFPGAGDLEAFWRNIVAGVDSITHLNKEDLEYSYLEMPGVRELPNYVRARGILDGIETFDAEFFGVSAREAELMDPQHRLLLETAWEAFESAGCDPASYPGLIGVWATTSAPTYLWSNILPRRDVLTDHGAFQAILANERDYLATRISYKLNLRGPSVNVFTACSSSLVAICQAYQALLSFQCDVALAGAVSVMVPQRQGHLYQEGAIGSKDGRCRSFDALATGTVFSDGVGVVVLKRLEDALLDKDPIHAVIRGVAVNNDGATKAGFTAPSVDGQAEAIQLAQDLAGIDPDTIGYIEAHGTATPIGDPIEVAALTQAFRKQTKRRQFCALGSVKSNIGHLDAAAGMAGFVKAVLAIENAVLPPTAHFKTPNPAIDFASSPFYVSAEARPWPAACRRAGVSSFGVGGTNAHVVLEQGPPSPRREMLSASRMLVLSARSETALLAMRTRLAECLGKPESPALLDVAHTLAVGRRAFANRLAFACASKEEAIEVLSGARLSSAHFGRKGKTDPRVAFLFPGQGSQRPAMAQTLYRLRPSFAADVDACVRAFAPHVGFDLRTLLLAVGPPERTLDDTAVTQPALFAAEYCLARLWLSLGVDPVAMVGHSLGEYVAACIAGVFSLEESALLVASRGRLMQEQPRGSMMTIQLSPEELAPKLGPNVVIAACNAPQSTVVAGPREAIELLASQLAAQDVRSKLLATSHAFHSPMMEGMLRPFRAVFDRVSPKAPQRPWISCVTGAPITPNDAVDPDYWVRQIREPVQFSRAVRALGQDSTLVFIEVGPGRALAAMVEQHTDRANGDNQVVLSLGKEAALDERAFADAACQLWCSGVKVAISSFTSAPDAHLVPLPTYPFDRKRYWIAASGVNATISADCGKEKAGTRVGAQGNAPGSGARNSARGDQAEANLSVEERLTRLLAGLLRVGPSDIDPGKTMLEMGFDSLLFVQLGVRLQRAFGVSLTLRDLMDAHTTPKALAEYLEGFLGQIPAARPQGESDPPSANATTTDPRVAPVVGARLGRDGQGNPAWFVPDPNRPGKYLQVK